jgi:CHAD domain-containing protein
MSLPLADEGPNEVRTAAFLARKARMLDDALALAQPRVMGNTDSEAVHDLRVALRRLRTLLKLARPVFGEFHSDAVRTAFADLQASTGELRDEEALGETLDAVAVHSAPLAEWRARRLVRDRRLRRGLVTRLRQGELDRARALLNAILTLPVRPDRDPPLSKFGRRAVQKAREAVEARRDTPPDDALGLHALRIAYKKLRYAVEFFTEALPIDLVALAEPAARFQKRLGEIHDIDVAKISVARARGLDRDTRMLVIAALDVARLNKLAKYVAEMNPVAATPVDGTVTPPVSPG